MLRGLLILGCLLVPAVRAQNANREIIPETTFRTTTDLVQLNVSIYDKQGKIVRGLPQSAFTVFEDNVKQEIKVFRQEDVPVSLGLIVDNSASMRDKRDRVASAAIAMVKASNPDDEVFVINFNEEATVAQELTNNIGLLEKSLRSVNSQGLTAMRDAVLRGVAHLKNKARREKKVLVAITDGDDNSSVGTQEHLIDVAHRHNAIIYAIGLLGGEQSSVMERARKQIEELALATGGRAWFPNNLDEMAGVTPEIAHEIRNQYIIGYTPANDAPTGKFRSVRVEVNVPGVTVRTRSGYYAKR
jgi:VWFA-related protein